MTAIIRKLLKRLAAKDRLLAAYRTGGHPSEATFKALEETEGVEAEALAVIEKARATPQGETT